MQKYRLYSNSLHDLLILTMFASSSVVTYEPRREKTGLRGFRPGPTQTDLYKLIKELEA